MSELLFPVKSLELNGLKTRQLDRMARQWVLALLEKLGHGKIKLIENGHCYEFGDHSNRSSLEADDTIHHPRFYTRILFGGQMGAAEAYMKELWSSDDLTAVIRILLLNRTIFRAMQKGPARLTAPLYDFFQLIRKNTKAGSRKNIYAHYDLGNTFYELFLDETMTIPAVFLKKKRVP